MALTIYPDAIAKSLELFPLPSTPTPLIFVHIVTLRHPMTGDEQSIEVETTSDRFCDVYRAVCWKRTEMKLGSYEIFEVLDCNDPF